MQAVTGHAAITNYTSVAKSVAPPTLLDVSPTGTMPLVVSGAASSDDPMVADTERSGRRLLQFLRGLMALAILSAMASSMNSARAGDFSSGRASGSATCMPARLANVAIGFTLNHIDVAPADPATCKATRGRASLAGAKNIILDYDQPGVRERIRGYLGVMAKEGARSARTIIWYSHAEDRPMAAARSKQAQDILGMPVATDGHLPEAYINNLQSFAADLVASGYVRYYVNIAPMGTSNPRTSASECKGGRGNCFNPDLMALDWSVAQQVISSLRAALGHKIDLVFDLASEQCLFDPNVELFRNYDSFVRYMLSRYKETFGSGGFVISCGAGNGLAPKAVAGLRSLGERYRELRIKPAAIDVHVYPTNLPAIMSLLRTANEVADQLRVPVDIAETYANNELILSSVSDMVQSRQLNLRTIMMYPTTAENQCNIPAPYDISSFDVMLGRRNAAGAKKQVCN